MKHPDLPLVLLNYDQLNSPKLDPVVMECRGLMLEVGTWRIISRGFNRFFNLGEAQELQKNFNWDRCITYEKMDGSYVGITGYQGKLLIHTRGSFADGICYFSEKSWKELILECLNAEQIEVLNREEFCQVFEYCGPYNQIVKYYEKPRLVLLTSYHKKNECEVDDWAVDDFARLYKFERPRKYAYNSISAVLEALDNLYRDQSTDEGFVAFDGKDRIKCKNKYHLALHQLGNNGNIASYKVLLPLVLVGEQDEVVAYWPYLKTHIDEIRMKLEEEYKALFDAWRMTVTIVERKKFAQEALKRCPKFSGLLFKLKDAHDTESTEEHLKDIWRQSGDLLYKTLFHRKEDKEK